MCNPALLAMTPQIMAAVTAAVGVYSTVQQSNATNDVFESNQDAAIRAQRDGIEAQAVAANQGREAAGQAATQNALNAAKARASATVSAHEAGISGISLDALMADIDRTEANNYNNLATNQAWAEDQRVRSGAGIAAAARDRINAAPRSNFNPVVSLLQIGSQAAGQYYSAKGG